jgi:glycosyltransferase involved in cell wall biosynthesis
MTIDCTVVVSTSWGTRFGGINVFNLDFCLALAGVTKSPVVCVVPTAGYSDVEQALCRNVRLVPLNRELSGDFYKSTDAADLIAVLKNNDINSVGWWIGHDFVTGEVITAARDEWGSGKTIIIHHMDYRAFESMKSYDGPAAIEKDAKQQMVLSSADIVCAVGPKLAKAARDKLKKAGKGTSIDVLELHPGLQSIKGIPETEMFTAVTFGRLDPRTDQIKMGKLAVAAFGEAAKDNGLGEDPTISVVGLESSELIAENRLLAEIAGKYAGRRLAVNGCAYNEDRDQLFHLLSQHSAALVLSIHEGFGLTAWEAIAAEVPLVLTKNSGAYQLIEQLLGGKGIGCLKLIDIKGTPGSEELNGEDVTAASRALRTIGANTEARAASKRNAVELKCMLQERVSWAQMAKSFCKQCGLPVEHKPISIGIAAGHADAIICGSFAEPTERTDEQERALGTWYRVAICIGEILATATTPPFHLNFTGVDGGSFGGAVVRSYSNQAKSEAAITTLIHNDFADDDEAKEAIAKGWQNHFKEHNVDVSQPYLYLPGHVLRVGTMSKRRMNIIKNSDVLFCVAGYFAVEESIYAAELKGIPIVAIGAFGGMTKNLTAEIFRINKEQNLPTSLQVALHALATAPLDVEDIAEKFIAVLEEIKKNMEK